MKINPFYSKWKEGSRYSILFRMIYENVMKTDVVDGGLEITDRDADANVVYPDAYIESRDLEIVDRDAGCWPKCLH